MRLNLGKISTREAKRVAMNDISNEVLINNSGVNRNYMRLGSIITGDNPWAYQRISIDTVKL
jgi:hypothetical protein